MTAQEAWEKFRKDHPQSFRRDNLGDGAEYLFNRLWWAFHDGYAAGLEAGRGRPTVAETPPQPKHPNEPY